MAFDSSGDPSGPPNLVPWDQGQSPTHDQLQVLTHDQLQALTHDQLQALTPNQLQALTHDQLQALTPNQLQALTHDQLQALTPNQLQALTPDQLQWLTLSQLQALTSNQVQALTPDQLQATALPFLQPPAAEPPSSTVDQPPPAAADRPDLQPPAGAEPPVDHPPAAADRPDLQPPAGAEPPVDQPSPASADEQQSQPTAAGATPAQPPAADRPDLQPPAGAEPPSPGIDRPPPPVIDRPDPLPPAAQPPSPAIDQPPPQATDEPHFQLSAGDKPQSPAEVQLNQDIAKALKTAYQAASLSKHLNLAKFATETFELAERISGKNAPDWVARLAWRGHDAVAYGASSSSLSGVLDSVQFKLLNGGLSALSAYTEAEGRGVGEVAAKADAYTAGVLTLTLDIAKNQVWGSWKALSPLDTALNVVDSVTTALSPRAGQYTKILADATPSQTAKQLAVGFMDTTVAVFSGDTNQLINHAQQNLEGRYGNVVRGYAILFDAAIGTALQDNRALSQLSDAAAGGRLGPLATGGDWLGDQVFFGLQAVSGAGESFWEATKEGWKSFVRSW
jgi:hypothetical protein